MERTKVYGWIERINADAAKGVTADEFMCQSALGLRVTTSDGESPGEILVWDTESCRALHALLCKLQELEG